MSVRSAAWFDNDDRVSAGMYALAAVNAALAGAGLAAIARAAWSAAHRLVG